MTDQEKDTHELEKLCCNCNHAHPAPYSSDWAICLNDPEFDPYLDDILNREDFKPCIHLVKQKRFAWDQEGCEDFDPIEDSGIELQPELAADIEKLIDRGELTKETFMQALAKDYVNRTDWREAPVDSYVEKLIRPGTDEQRDSALNHLGWLVSNQNRAAFDALCDLLGKLEKPATLSRAHFKCRLLDILSRSNEYRKDLADLLVDDLFRTPSNPKTRGWYTAVFRFFETTAPDLADECLGRVLDSPKFSYRIKRRVREIIRRYEEIDG